MDDSAPLAAEPLDRRLNRDCFCITLDAGQLSGALDRELADPALWSRLSAERPNLFSQTQVFLAKADLAAMLAAVRAAEAAAGTAAYQAATLAWAPAIARHDSGPNGAFRGYDFHLGPDGPRLIEINTNAGGGFLNAQLARAHAACCSEVEAAFSEPLADGFEADVWAMFVAEWRRQRGAGEPSVIAIVDERPQDQYLYPEFVLAQRLFERQGVTAVIADPAELAFDGSALRLGGLAIDLVYNRLTDFSLEQPAQAALREAYLAGAVVLTPGPRPHALLADKRNLTLLSDADFLKGLTLSADALDALAATVPQACLVSEANAEALWGERKRLFFKPAGGYGSKAVYRGDKLTRGVWADIVQGGYIAQAAAPPSERMVRIDGREEPRKLDVRLYTYGGALLLAAARLYQGQTTNFRTEGGGFAPVHFLPRR